MLENYLQNHKKTLVRVTDLKQISSECTFCFLLIAVKFGII